MADRGGRLRRPAAIAFALAVAAGCGGLIDAGAIDGTDDAGAEHDGAVAPDDGTPAPIADAQTADRRTLDASGFDVAPIDASRPHNTKVVIVHASPNVGAFRVCFGVGASPAVVASAFPALPDQARASQTIPGIDPGSGGVFPDLGIDVSALPLTPFVILAARLGGDTRTGGPKNGKERSCSDLIGVDGKGAALKPGVDYFQLATLPAGTFPRDAGVLVGLAGCAPASLGGGSTDKCGLDWTAANGNLRIQIIKLSTTPAPPIAMGFSVAHLSLPLQGWPGGKTGIYPSVIVDAVTGSSPSGSLGGPYQEGTLGPSPWIPITALDPARAGIGVALAPGGKPLLVTTFKQIQLLTLGSSSPTDFFANGWSYTMVVVGDPAEPPLVGAAPNPKALHVLAFRNDLGLPPL